DGAGRLGGAVRGDHRRGAEHRAADRAGRDRAAGDQGPGPGRGRGGGHRGGGHLARHPARLRQLLLAARGPRLAGQLLRGDADRRRLPDQLPAPAGGPGRARPRCGARMFGPLMINTWIAATAVAFVLMLGIGALFVSWSSGYAQEAYSLLFGEVFGVSADQVLPILVLGAVSVAAIVAMFRPLMFSSALPEVAEARGVSARRMELAFLLVMALATSMTVPVVGALLMFSLMIGPAAAARSLTARPVLAMALSVAIALVTVWTGIVVSYQSNWP